MMEKMKSQLDSMSPEERDKYAKMLGDPMLDGQARMDLLEKIGMPVKGTPEDRIKFLHGIGVTPESDPKLYDQVKRGGVK
jgi:hypothetical protein